MGSAEADLNGRGKGVLGGVRKGKGGRDKQGGEVWKVQKLNGEGGRDKQCGKCRS